MSSTYGRRVSPRCSGREGGPQQSESLARCGVSLSLPGRLPLGTPPLKNSARPMSLITGMTHKCPVGRGCVGKPGHWQNWSPMGFQPLGGALGGHPHLSCWVALGSAPGFMQAGWQPEGVWRGLPAAGLEPPSPWDGVCVKMRSSWGQAPRGQTSAKSKQNPSGGQQNSPKVWALCSDGASTVIRRRGGVCVLPTVEPSDY